jgi:hypothetical protein
VFTLRRGHGCESELTAGDRERRASLAKSGEGKELMAVEVAGSGRLNRRAFCLFCVPRWPVFLVVAGIDMYTVTELTAIHIYCRTTNYVLSYFIKYAPHQKTF